MQYLTFRLDGDEFVLASSDVVKVLPLVRLNLVPQAPVYVAGMLEYQGENLVVIDLCRLLLERPCKQLLSTRLVLLRCPLPTGSQVTVGVLLEQAVGTVKLDQDGWRSSPLQLGERQLMTELQSVDGRTLQKVAPQRLLTDEILVLLNADH